MADKVGYKPNVTTGNTAIPLTFKDMSDGTYAEVVAFDAGPITIGTVDQGDAGADPWPVTGEVSQGAAGTDPWLVTDAGSKLGTGGTGTAAAIAAAIGGSLACQSVLLTNTHATLTLLFGNVTAQVVPLNPGAFVSLPATNVNQIYVIDGTGHATFAYVPVIAA
jgi:hypothetical protein